jgi:hypothetical protein
MPEPLWRKVLCWGSVLIFILTPPVLLTLQILDHLSARDVEVAKSMSPMYIAISGVMASLAGLNTYAGIKNERTERKRRTISLHRSQIFKKFVIDPGYSISTRRLRRPSFNAA